MERSLALIILIVGVVNSQQLPSTLAQSNYCDILSLTTPELALDIQQNPINQSNSQIKLTQNYQLNNTTLALTYIQSQQDLILQTTTSDLVSTLYTENVSNDLVFIDAQNGFILAIEIIDQINNFYDYVLLKANVEVANSSKIMTRFSVIP